MQLPAPVCHYSQKKCCLTLCVTFSILVTLLFITLSLSFLSAWICNDSVKFICKACRWNTPKKIKQMQGPSSGICTNIIKTFVLSVSYHWCDKSPGSPLYVSLCGSVTLRWVRFITGDHSLSDLVRIKWFVWDVEIWGCLGLKVCPVVRQAKLGEACNDPNHAPNPISKQICCKSRTEIASTFGNSV